MEQVFPLQIDFGSATMLRESRGETQLGRTPRKLLQVVPQLRQKHRVISRQIVSGPQVLERGHERLRHIHATVTTEMTARVDPSILGGLKVKVGSKLFDASLKTKLDQMKFALKRA